MIVIDGSKGEGGGQILRSSLALSLLTGQPFRVHDIRAGRQKPGLLRQHLAAVRGASAISDAVVQGAELGSRELVFTPGSVKGGTYTFSVGSAGSATLVFQTVLLPLLLRGGAPSSLTFEGGTHNPMAPPFDFVARAFLPLLRKMGADVRVDLSAHGFYPAGGGVFTADVASAPSLAGLSLLDRGAHVANTATSVLSRVPIAVATKELDTLTSSLGWDRSVGRPSRPMRRWASTWRISSSCPWPWGRGESSARSRPPSTPARRSTSSRSSPGCARASSKSLPGCTASR